MNISLKPKKELELIFPIRRTTLPKCEIDIMSSKYRFQKQSPPKTKAEKVSKK